MAGPPTPVEPGKPFTLTSVVIIGGGLAVGPGVGGFEGLELGWLVGNAPSACIQTRRKRRAGFMFPASATSVSTFGKTQNAMVFFSVFFQDFSRRARLKIKLSVHVQSTETAGRLGKLERLGRAEYFPQYLGPTLVKIYRAGGHLTSSQLVQCAMGGEYGKKSNWREWRPTGKEQFNMLIAARVPARDEEQAANATFDYIVKEVEKFAPSPTRNHRKNIFSK